MLEFDYPDSLCSFVLQDQVRAARMAKEYTQEKVVAELQLKGSKMSRSTLANIEAGRRNIKASDLKLLKVFLDVSYDEFFKD